MVTKRFIVPNPTSRNLSFTVPYGASGVWMARSITAEAQTDATVGARLFACRVKDEQGNVYAEWTAPQTQAASQEYLYSWLIGMATPSPSASGTTATLHVSMPEIIVVHNDVIEIVDLNDLALGDRIKNCVIVLDSM